MPQKKETPAEKAARYRQQVLDLSVKASYQRVTQILKEQPQICFEVEKDRQYMPATSRAYQRKGIPEPKLPIIRRCASQKQGIPDIQHCNMKHSRGPREESAAVQHNIPASDAHHRHCAHHHHQHHHQQHSSRAFHPAFSQKHSRSASKCTFAHLNQGV